MKLTTIVTASLLLAPLAAHAQWSPSADDLVKLLQPKAGGATRGIRALTSPGVTPGPSPTVLASRPVPIQPRTTLAMAHPSAPPMSTPPAVHEDEGVNLTVQFENGADRLTPAAIRVLDELGRALSSPSLTNYKFRIVGHTDSVGSRDVNQTLSERRAHAVSDFITSHYSVQRARLTSVGMGQSEPLVATPDGVAEPRNRRVQVINVGS